MSFKDHFSGHAASYAAARPTYPDSLFAYLAEQSPALDLALDCATGNGQAALALAAHFRKVIATDASQAQIDQASPHERIEYRCHPAEAEILPPGSVDLISVAQALHWLDLPLFFNSVQSMLKPGGLLAVWSYGIHHITPQVDEVCARYYDEIVGAYWPPERRVVESGYADIEFPLPQITTPEFAMSKLWRIEDLLAYLNSWSATQRYMLEHDSNPLLLVEQEMEDAWGDADTREIHWPLTLKLCRNS